MLQQAFDRSAPAVRASDCDPCAADVVRGGDTVGNPHRAQIVQFELFELILLLKLDNKFPVEQFEATVSQSTVPSPLSAAGLRIAPFEPNSGLHAAVSRVYTCVVCVCMVYGMITMCIRIDIFIHMYIYI